MDEAGGRIGRAVAARPRVALLVALGLAGMALRPQLIGVQPLLPLAQDDLGISHAVAGLLITIPVACLGLCAPFAPFVSSRLGLRWAIAALVALIAAAGIARPFGAGILAVLVLTVPIGIGMGLGNALMPVAAKTWFARRAVLATGIYVSGIQLAQVVPAAIAVPLAEAGTGWRTPLLVFGCFTALLVVAWLVLTRGAPGASAAAGPPRAPIPLGDPVVWLLAGLFTAQGLVFYGLGSWLPDAYVERGWSDAAAGSIVAVLNAVSLATSATLPWLMERGGTRRQYLVGAGLGVLAASLGFVLAPGAVWLWVVLGGIALSATFVVTLALPLDLTHEPAQVGAVVAVMLGVGYTLAALAPFVLGAVRDATGSFEASLWLVVGFAAATLAFAIPFSSARIRAGLRSGGGRTALARGA